MQIKAKCKFDVSKNSDSLFSCRDAVYYIYIIKKISKKILLLSQTAIDYSEANEKMKYEYNQND